MTSSTQRNDISNRNNVGTGCREEIVIANLKRSTAVKHLAQLHISCTPFRRRFQFRLRYLIEL